MNQDLIQITSSPINNTLVGNQITDAVLNEFDELALMEPVSGG